MESGVPDYLRRANVPGIRCAPSGLRSCATANNGMSADQGRVRIDKWLWAARFFKTRALAQAAVVAGKVRLHGERIKPAKEVRVGDALAIRIGEYECRSRPGDLRAARSGRNGACAL